MALVILNRIIACQLKLLQFFVVIEYNIKLCKTPIIIRQLNNQKLTIVLISACYTFGHCITKYNKMPMQCCAKIYKFPMKHKIDISTRQRNFAQMRLHTSTQYIFTIVKLIMISDHLIFFEILH